jgi:hypothetical protein
MSDPIGTGLKLLGKGLQWFAGRPDRVAMIHHGMRTVNEEFIRPARLKISQSRVMTQANASAATTVIENALDVDEIDSLHAIFGLAYEKVRTSPDEEAEISVEGLAQALDDDQVADVLKVLKVAEALACDSTISPTLDDIVSSNEPDNRKVVDEQEQTRKRLYLTLVILWLYLAAMMTVHISVSDAGQEIVGSWEAHVATAALLADAIYFLMYRKNKDKR